MGNDDGPECADLCAALDGSGRGGAGLAAEVCADGDPGVAGEEGRDVFSTGPTAVHDSRFAIVLADSVGPPEGVERKRYQTSVARYHEVKKRVHLDSGWRHSEIIQVLG